MFSEEGALGIKIGSTYFLRDECPSCDKIEDEFRMGGVCEDAFGKNIAPPRNGKRRTGLAYRRAMALKKRNDLFQVMNYGHSRHAGYMDWEYQNGVVSLVGKYVKFPKNSNRQQYWKKYSNRAVRRGKEVGSGKSGYKRCFDYWWTID